MLAMKIAVTDSEIQTLVFDEIDTGISGITAQKMAEKLKELSASYQVLLVTQICRKLLPWPRRTRAAP